MEREEWRHRCAQSSLRQGRRVVCASLLWQTTWCLLCLYTGYAFNTQGLDVNKAELNGRHPIHYAADYGQSDIIDILVAHGADVNVGCMPTHPLGAWASYLPEGCVFYKWQVGG